MPKPSSQHSSTLIKLNYAKKMFFFTLTDVNIYIKRVIDDNKNNNVISK